MGVKARVGALLGRRLIFRLGKRHTCSTKLLQVVMFAPGTCSLSLSR